MNQSEEIKSRLDIVDIIRDYIQLKPAGANFRALCPFHKEKSPSFMVSPEKQIFHCFGCEKGGDLLTFVMEMEGINFIESMRILAPKAGVKLIEKGGGGVNSSKRNRLLDILSLSSEYYHRNLLKSDKAKKYLTDRGLDEENVRKWEIGFSSDSWDDIILFLKSKKYTDEEILAAGMSVHKSNKYFNRFRNRIMFPISDVNANVIGFTARVMPGDEASAKMGKYVNSPQTDVYDKSRVLFGIDKAKVGIKNENLAIIVEGQMDVITAHKHGFTNIIASSGTALTKEQIGVIKRYTKNIVFAFDMDKAGQMAVERGIEQAVKLEMNIKIINVPNGKDPDECIRKDPEEWEKAVEEAKDVMQYFLNKLFKDINTDDINEVRKSVSNILDKLSRFIGDSEVEKSFWIQKISSRSSIPEESLKKDLENIKNTGRNIEDYNKNVEKIVVREKQDREEKSAELLLALAIKFPEFLDYIISNIELEYIYGALNKQFYKNLIIYYNSNEAIKYKELKSWLQDNDSESLNLLDKLVLLGDNDYYDIENRVVKNEIIKIISHLRKHHNQNKMKVLEREIANAELNNETDKVNQLMEKMRVLSVEMKENNILN